MRKVTIAIMIILILLALFVFYDYGVPHVMPGSTMGTRIELINNQTLNYTGNFSQANYTTLLTDYGVLVTSINILIHSFHQELAAAYQKGLFIGIFTGLAIGFLFGAVLEGVRRKNKSK